MRITMIAKAKPKHPIRKLPIHLILIEKIITRRIDNYANSLMVRKFSPIRTFSINKILKFYSKMNKMLK